MRGRGFCGFTIIELLVTIAIISGLITFLLPQLNSFQRQQVLKDSSAQLQTALRSAQNSAVSGVKCNNGSAASNWFLKFTSANKGQYEVGRVCDGTVEQAKLYNLPDNVTVSNIKVDTCSSIDLLDGNQWAKAVFNNISGDVGFSYSHSGCPSSNPNRMEINLIDPTLSSNNQSTVVIERGGAIYLSPFQTAAAPSPSPSSSSPSSLSSSSTTPSSSSELTESVNSGTSEGGYGSGIGSGGSTGFTPTPTISPGLSSTSGSGGTVSTGGSGQSPTQSSTGSTPTPAAGSSQSSTACTLTSASWLTSVNPVVSGTNVGLLVDATGNCNGKQVTFEVMEADLVGSDSVSVNPESAVFLNNQAVGTWTAEYQQDMGGLFDPPEFYFNAIVLGTSQVFQSADPKLQVSQSSGGGAQPTSIPTPTSAPTPSVNTVTLEAIDDGYSINGWGNNESSEIIRIGRSPDTLVGPYDAGFIFSLPVAKKSTISKAVLSVYLHYSWENLPVKVSIQAEKTTNSPPLGGWDSSNFIANRKYFNKSIDWTVPISSWSSYVDSPDIQTIIEDVVSQNGWVSGNNILIAINKTSDANFAQLFSKDSFFPKKAKLTVTYVSP